MSWRTKLGVPENHDRSDQSQSSVTSVTSTAYIRKVDEATNPPHPERLDFVRARYLLNRAEVRKIVVAGELVIGIWSDLDGPDIRAALRVLDADRLPVRYLDGAGIPMQYKLRRAEGEPLPINVLGEMERHPRES